jgi:large subunit ribosomal protein L25
MDNVLLKAEPRNKSVKAKHLLLESLLPAEIYGSQQENLSVQMDYQDFRKAYIVAGENTVIDLTVGEGASRKVLVQNVDFEPVSGKMRHVDFVNVNMNKPVHANIPLDFVGTSSAVKDLGGMLMTNITEIEVKCLPGDLIHSIEVDISVLEDFNTVIHVSDLNISDKLEVLVDMERTVASVSAPAEEEVDEPVGAAVPEGEEGAEGEEGVEGAEGGEAKEEGAE